ncbi:hypothetical protein FNYG_10805 [Fusarium nygamai]|uniref:Uncharacterized protein n=1 Tax=Gibberella nygamai TaxID=42673 RepID=A0A2K0W0Z7_GIBNY|nr:hypothetical protein FNYG_10805 [Fusarium nygamai]
MNPALGVLFFTGSDKPTSQSWTSLPRPLSPQPKFERGPDHSASSTAPPNPVSTAALDPDRRCLLDASFFESLVVVSVASTRTARKPTPRRSQASALRYHYKAVWRLNIVRHHRRWPSRPVL